MRRHAPLALVGIAVVLAACVTAVLSHVLIDALGDVLLRVDAYDHVAHGSRLIALASIVASAALALLSLWCAAFGEARRAGGTLRATLATAAARARSPLTLVATVGLAIGMIAAMEVFDVARAGGTGVDLRGALGGSLWLGLGVTSLCASVAAGCVARVLGALARAYGCLVVVAREAILAIRRIGSQADAIVLAGARRAPLRARRTIMSRRAFKRGPPLRLQVA